MTLCKMIPLLPVSFFGFCHTPPTSVLSSPAATGSSQLALWVAFFEIYNECVYDLLQPSLCSKNKKRAALRVCDDGAGNAYIKGMRVTLSCVLEAVEGDKSLSVF